MINIPKSIDIKDPEVISFLAEFLDVGIKSRADVKTILEKWDKVQEKKEKDPNYWHLQGRG